ELRAALDAGAGVIVIDSFDEIDRLELLGEADGARPRVMVRITPGVEAHTHEFVRTGNDDSKFGFTVSTGAADRAIARVKDSPFMELIGIHSHIGSQVFREESFAEAAAIIGEFTRRHGLEELSVGGGLGVPYVSGETAPTITDWAKGIRAGLESVGYEGEL